MAAKKLKRGGKMVLELVDNPDILRQAAKRKRKVVSVGFALETEALAKNALKKLREKKLDFVVANELGHGRRAFGDNATDVLIIDRFGNKAVLRRKTKRELAKIVLDKALNFTI